jgi:hypothetical protein
LTFQGLEVLAQMQARTETAPSTFEPQPCFVWIQRSQATAKGSGVTAFQICEDNAATGFQEGD